MKFLTINGKLQRDSSGGLITIPDNYDNSAITLNGKLLKTSGGLIGSNIIKRQLSTPVISLVSGTTIQINTIDENATMIEVYADGTKIGEVAKQGGATKQTIDVSTLSWESLTSGDHSITTKAKASGYLDSESSNAVTVSKAAPLNRPTIESLSHSKYIKINNPSSNGNNVTAFKIYNDNDLLGTIDASKTLFNPADYLTNSGSYNIGVKASGTNFSDSALSNTITVYKSYPPTISLNGYTLTIAKNEQNLTNMDYDLYSDNEQVININGLTKDLTTEFKFVIGQTYNLTVRAGRISQKWYTSDNSNVVAYTCETVRISPTLTSVTAASSNATTISVGETKVLTYTATAGYELPDNVTVTGATGVWNKANGTLTLSNPTAHVTFTIEGVPGASGYNVTINEPYSYGVDIYDGTSSSGTRLGSVSGDSKTVVCASGNLYLTSNSARYTDNTVVTGGVMIVSENSNYYDGTFKVTADGTITLYLSCFVEGTQITLADGSTKPVEDIDYTDDILVWDFDNGVQSSAKPCWIAKPNVAPCYWEITLSDGTILKLVGANGKSHRLFNSRGKFVYPQDFENGEQTVKQDGSTPYIVKCEKIYKEVKYYNFATDRALNNYANGVLCGCRFSNVYPIEDMKYVKDDRALATREEYKEIPDKLFYGLRLAEQQNLNDSPDNVNYYHTMKEHVIHNYMEHERDYTGNADYETWLFKQKK